MTGPREVRSEIQQFQCRLDSTLPVAKPYFGVSRKRKKYLYDAPFQSRNCLFKF